MVSYQGNIMNNHIDPTTLTRAQVTVANNLLDRCNETIKDAMRAASLSAELIREALSDARSLQGPWSTTLQSALVDLKAARKLASKAFKQTRYATGELVHQHEDLIKAGYSPVED